MAATTDCFGCGEDMSGKSTNRYKMMSSSCARAYILQLFHERVVWKYFYSTTSASEHGTLYQLRNLIRRCNVSKKPKAHFDACDDFFKSVTASEILAVALHLLGMKTLNDVPTSSILPTDVWLLNADQRKALLLHIANKVVSYVVDINYNTCPNSPLPSTDDTGDHIYQYAQQLVSLGCIYLEYDDSIKEGDGEGVLRCWKYLLPIFLNSGRKNYSYEALLLLCQHEYLLSPQQAQRLKYSRFVNTKGQQGKNIPADLHNEHLNRACKNAIGGLGSNTSVQRIELVSKSIGTIAPVIDNYDNENTVTPSSGRHAKASSYKDVNLLVNQLQESNIFTTQKTRKHLSFPRTKSLLHKKSKEVTEWIMTRMPYK